MIEEDEGFVLIIDIIWLWLWLLMVF